MDTSEIAKVTIELNEKTVIIYLQKDNLINALSQSEIFSADITDAKTNKAYSLKSVIIEGLKAD